MQARRWTLLVAMAAAALAAVPARAAWVRSPAAGQATTQPLRALAIGPATPAWAVGGVNGAPVVLRSSDQFQTSNGTVLVASGVADRLDAVWADSTGATVHALGLDGARASYAVATRAWTTSSPFAPGAQFDVAAMAFVDATLGYLAGQSAGAGALARWSPGSLAEPVALPAGTGPLVGAWYAARDQGLLLAANGLLTHAGLTPTMLWSVPGAGLTALSVQGSRGIAVGTSLAAIVTVNGAASTVRVPTARFPIALPTAVALAPRNFAVAVGRGGALAESQDGGETWTLRASGTQADLLAVRCADENTCVAAGAGGELLTYQNHAPSAVATNTAGPLDVDEGDLICLKASTYDADGDAVSVVWSDLGNGFTSSQGVPFEGSTSLTPPCFRAPHLCQDQTVAVTITVDDGRLSQVVPIPFAVRAGLGTAPRTPTLTPAPQYTWAVGEVHTLVADAYADCARPVQFSWSASGALPAPAADLTDPSRGTVTFDLRQPPSCNGGVGAITVVAQTPDGATSQPLVITPVTIAAAQFKPSVELHFSDGAYDGATVADGATTTVTVLAHHGCASSFDYAWSCHSADPAMRVPTPGNVASVPFTNGNASCSEQELSCTVTVTPTGQQVSETKSFRLRYGVRANRLDLRFSALQDGATLPFGDSTTINALPSSECDPDPSLTWQFAWTCSGPVPPPTTSVSRFTVTSNNEDCADEREACTVTGTPSDGGPSAVATFRLMLPAHPKIQLTSRLGGECSTLRPLNLGESLICDASGCSDATFTWTCSTPGQTPVVSIGPTFVFSNSGTCEATPMSCSIDAVRADGSSYDPKDVTIRIAATLNETVVDVVWDKGFTNGGTVPSGGTQAVSLHASTPLCAWAYNYDWACTGVQPRFLDESRTTAVFEHPDRAGEVVCGTSDANASATCLVVATPIDPAMPDQNPPASVTLNLNFAPTPTSTSLQLVFKPPEFTSGGVLAEGKTVEAGLHAGNPCATRWDFVWDCDNYYGPEPQGYVGDFHHPGSTCGRIAPTSCKVRAVPIGRPTETAHVEFTINYAPTLFPPSVQVGLSDGKADGDHLASGESVTATVSATHYCNARLAYLWKCHNDPTPGTDQTTKTIANDALLCVPEYVGCSIVVVPLDGNPESAPVAFELVRDPTPISLDIDLDFSEGHADGSPVEPGETVRVIASVHNACASKWTPRIEWSCDDPSAVPEQNPAILDVLNARGRCVDKTLHCTVRAVPPYGLPPSERTFTLKLLHEDVPAPDLRTITNASYDPAATLALDCERRTPLRLMPRFGPAGPPACGVDWSWRQVTSLPLEVEMEEDGTLEVRAEPGRDADLFGETARFEVTAKSINSPSTTRRFEAKFLPQRVVEIEHRADRVAAATGEEVGFAVTLHNRCASIFQPVDLRLRLDRLAFVEGSGTLDGEPLAEARHDGSTAFATLALPPAGRSLTLSYRARVSGLDSGPAQASATAVLSHRPDIAVSDEASTAGEVPVSCRCGAGGAPATGLFGWLLIGLAARRRRPRC